MLHGNLKLFSCLLTNKPCFPPTTELPSLLPTTRPAPALVGCPGGSPQGPGEENRGFPLHSFQSTGERPESSFLVCSRRGNSSPGRTVFPGRRQTLLGERFAVLSQLCTHSHTLAVTGASLRPEEGELSEALCPEACPGESRTEGPQGTLPAASAGRNPESSRGSSPCPSPLWSM